MALLDTFVSIFESDTDGLRRGHDQARRSTDDIVKSMKEAEDQSKKTGDSMISMAKKAAGFLAAAVAASKTLSGVMQQAADINLMNQTAQSIGVSIENMDAFSRSIKDAGGTAHGAEQSLTNLFRSIGDAAMSSGSSQGQAFASLGVNLRDAQGELRKTMDVMLDVAGAMESMEGAAAQSMAQKLGITDQRTIEVMLRGREALERTMRAQKEMGVVTEETAEKAAAFDGAMNMLTGGLDRAQLKMTDALLPAITWVIEKLGELVTWVNDNEDFVKGFFIAIATVVAVNYLPAMIAAAGATLIAIAPFLLIAAAIGLAAAAFAVIYDDIMNFIRGNDSFIGQIIDEYPALGRIITNLIDTIKTVFGVFGSILDWIEEKTGASFDGIGNTFRSFIGLLLGGLNQVAEWGEAFGQYFQDAADTVVGIFKWLWEQIQNLLGPIKGAFDFASGTLDKARGAVSGGVDTVKGWLGMDDDTPDVTPDINAANDTLYSASSEPMNSTTSQLISNSTDGRTENNVQVGEINIQTQATDAKGIAADTRSELADQLKNLNSQTAVGVDR